MMGVLKCEVMSFGTNVIPLRVGLITTAQHRKLQDSTVYYRTTTGHCRTATTYYRTSKDNRSTLQNGTVTYSAWSAQ